MDFVEGIFEIRKNYPLGIFAAEPENLKFHYVPQKKGQKEKIHVQIEDAKGNLATYTGSNVVNQAAKIAPGVIKMAANDINDIAKQRINQIVLQDGKEVEHIFPRKILP